MLDHNCGATQSLNQRQSVNSDEIVVLSDEAIVFQLLDHKHDIARKNSRLLICFARERNLLAVFHALIDRDLEDLTLLYNLFSLAINTTILVKNDRA